MAQVGAEGGPRGSVNMSDAQPCSPRPFNSQEWLVNYTHAVRARGNMGRVELACGEEEGAIRSVVRESSGLAVGKDLVSLLCVLCAEK